MSSRRFTDHFATRPEEVWSPRRDHPSIIGGRTLFPTTVVDAGRSPRLLVSGKNQRKIGSVVEKGPWSGMPVFCLTLEERATCPRHCVHWMDCMGNGMHFSRRHRAGHELENIIWEELDELAARNPSGFVVRLHILGDFYSVRYAGLWLTALQAIPALRVYGYTARTPGRGIGRMVGMMNDLFPERCSIRFSSRQPGPMRAVTINREPEGRRVAEGIICPVQTGAAECCATCALCWSVPARDQTIVFVLHGRKKPFDGKKS